mmetsp:Transcript_707/g.1184  ORF Transcript_707/g.1184 Transcript_707/m.1184 type:complete len:90 (-) Transcript_707:139-408(-)
MGGAISIFKCCQDSASENTKSSGFDVKEIAVPSQQDAVKCEQGLHRCTITGENIVVTAEEKRLSDMSVPLEKMDIILAGLVEEEHTENC